MIRGGERDEQRERAQEHDEEDADRAQRRRLRADRDGKLVRLHEAAHLPEQGAGRIEHVHLLRERLALLPEERIPRIAGKAVRQHVVDLGELPREQCGVGGVHPVEEGLGSVELRVRDARVHHDVRRKRERAGQVLEARFFREGGAVAEQLGQRVERRVAHVDLSVHALEQLELQQCLVKRPFVLFDRRREVLHEGRLEGSVVAADGKADAKVDRGGGMARDYRRLELCHRVVGDALCAVDDTEALQVVTKTADGCGTRGGHLRCVRPSRRRDRLAEDRRERRGKALWNIERRAGRHARCRRRERCERHE
mmetsp:Transcript_14497/g.38549  ORF Transcript_14497/g.38549 Transcript_14497/m.38549 type:complete len:310 (-) Transcript_14497:51-980(-)